MTTVKARVNCDYCRTPAKYIGGAFGVPRWEGWTRYGCANGHIFALPTHKVEVRKSKEAA